MERAWEREVLVGGEGEREEGMLGGGGGGGGGAREDDIWGGCWYCSAVSQVLVVVVLCDLHPLIRGLCFIYDGRGRMPWASLDDWTRHLDIWHKLQG
jgi:hypothetical protein